MAWGSEPAQLQDAPISPEATIPGPISPELALVDPELRALLLERSADDAGHFRRLAQRATPAAGASEPATRPARRHGKGPAVAAAFGSLVAIGIGVASMWGHSGADRSPATASEIARASEPTPPAAHVATATTLVPPPHTAGTRRPAHGIPAGPPPAKPAPHALAAQRLAWAPVPGATSYDVAFYQGDVRVLRTSTASPTIEVPVGRPASARRLAPGTYRWYVWPVHQRHVNSVAIVSTTLVVPARRRRSGRVT
jgi:hypothetical protein